MPLALRSPTPRLPLAWRLPWLAQLLAPRQARLSVLQAAYTAEVAFGELEDAYHRPLAGKEGEWPPPQFSPQS